MTSRTHPAAPRGRSQSSLLLITLLLVAVIFLPAAVRAQSPLDGFDPGYGASETVHAVAVQPDGKVLIGGQFMAVDGHPHIGVARLNADGSFDETFLTETNATVASLYVQKDGKILVGGGFTEIGGQPRGGLVRLNPDGTVDDTFDPRIAEGGVFAIAGQPDGKLVIGGFFTGAGGQPRHCIARVEADGRLDPTFNPGYGVDGYVSAIALQPDGRIVIGGQFSWVDGQARINLARLQTDGALDTSVQLDTDGPVHALAAQADGQILAGGSFTKIGVAWRVGLARFKFLRRGRQPHHHHPGRAGRLRHRASGRRPDRDRRRLPVLQRHPPRASRPPLS
ncbi:MAG: delta-60 repeat domain-containing protein [Thermoanaerobaculia bacterium]